MIIQGHPDILLGPRGLNGLHGFGSLPPENASPAYIRFLPEKGGAGIKALYQEIRDFINTPGRTEAEIQQAMEASGVSDEDVANAFASAPMQPTVEQSPYRGQPSAAYLRFLPENGGLGIDALYQEIRDFLATNPTQAELEQAMQASGVSTQDLINSKDYARPVPIVDTKQDYTFEEFCPPGSKLVDGVCVGDPSTYGPDIFYPDASPAFKRFLPENGGAGINVLYQEIRDFINTPGRTQAEIEQAKSASGVSDEDIANAFAAEIAEARIRAQVIENEKYYAEQVREQKAAEAAAAEAEARRIAALREAEKPIVETGRQQAYLEAQAAAAEAKAQSVIAAQAAQAQQALEATLAAQTAAAAAAAAQAAAQAAREAAAVAAARGADQAAAAATATAATAAAAQATAAATAAAASAATAAAIAVAKSPGQSTAYTRFLPENGGKGITALYKEISDFVAVSSNAEIKTAMTASGVSEVDVIKALEVFPNKVTVKTTETTAGAGLTFPLILSAIAAYFVLG